MNRSGALARARDRAKKAVSPRYRRWHATVDSLRFDPDDPEAVVEDLDPADFLICGPPRSGTALATAALFRPPEIVTVMEPWDALRMAPHDVVESVRRELRSTGALARGRLDMAALSVGRVGWRSDRETTTLVRTSPSTRIGIKLPGYWRYLPLMPETKFVVCLRDPSEVLESYRKHSGRINQGLEYEAALFAKMNQELSAATSDLETRRALFLEYMLSRIAPSLERSNVFALRYERWFDDRSGLLRDLAQFLGVDVGGLGRTVQIRKPIPARRTCRHLVESLCPSAAKVGYPG